MKHRTVLLVSAESILTAGTKTLNISTKDIISRITVIVRLTNSSWVPTGHPVLTVPTVQLVDGSEVLFSMSGAYAQAMAFYGTMKQPFNYINYTDNGLAVAEIPIYFGRHLWDREFGLDPKRHNNLQLKITHSYLLGGAVPSPMGMMRAESLWSQTLVANTNYRIDLPTDHDIRLLLPAVFSNSEEPDINIDSVRLTENAGKNILFDMGTLELLQMFERNWPVWSEHYEGRPTGGTSQTIYVTPCKDVLFAIHPSIDTDSVINTEWSGGNARVIDSSITATLVGMVHGRSPHGVFPLPLGEIDKPDSWWKIAREGSRDALLRTGGGDTSAVFELLMQQMKPY